MLALVGLLVALVAGRCAALLADKLRLQEAAERSGLARSISASGFARQTPQLVGDVVFWLLFAVFLVSSLSLLGIPGMTAAVDDAVRFVPKALAAIVLLVIGLLVSAYLRRVVAASSDLVRLGDAQLVANFLYYGLVLITVLAALNQLEFQLELLNAAVLITFASAALALGLAVGLGGREIMAGILCSYYLRQRFQAGDHVRVAGFAGTVREIGPVATVIETEENGMLNRHSIPNQVMLHESVR
jgi:hypothetical protein